MLRFRGMLQFLVCKMRFVVLSSAGRSLTAAFFHLFGFLPNAIGCPNFVTFSCQLDHSIYAWNMDLSRSFTTIPSFALIRFTWTSEARCACNSSASPRSMFSSLLLHFAHITYRCLGCLSCRTDEASLCPSQLCDDIPCLLRMLYQVLRNVHRICSRKEFFPSAKKFL